VGAGSGVEAVGRLGLGIDSAPWIAMVEGQRRLARLPHSGPWMNTSYLDHNATTPLAPEVLTAMHPWLTAKVGNASSLHHAGQDARRAIEQARSEVASLIGARPSEIVFVSGGTEANNLALLGSLTGQAPGSRSLAVTTVEHSSVLGVADELSARGVDVFRIPVDSEGLLDPRALEDVLPERTHLISVMLANNEVGTIQPLAEVVNVAHDRGILVHTDAVQAAGRLPIDMGELRVDLLSLSAHKMYGPQGIGALFVRGKTPLSPLCFGGRQERRLRPGTENVAAIVGFGRAAVLAQERLSAEAERLSSLRARFEAELLARVDGIRINGASAPRLCNTSSISFSGVESQRLLVRLDLLGIAASKGAACSSMNDEPSHVLRAMGRDESEARSSLRFSFGRGTQETELERAISVLAALVCELRGRS
jgi:cysteine desulfurase